MAIRFVTVDTDGGELIQDVQLPGHLNATNNQMELKACVVGLKEAVRLFQIHGVSRIIIRTDSMYVAENYQTAMFQWSRAQWFRRSGAPVLNADLWKDLLKAMRDTGVRVDIEWVRGHSKDEHNRAVDKMAKRSAKAAWEEPLSAVHVRRKLSAHVVDPGSVEMNGQRMSIRIISSEPLKVQKLWKCKYEVMTKTSDFYALVDIIYSDELLSPGHTYYVQVNDQTANPRVLKVFREIVSKK